MASPNFDNISNMGHHRGNFERPGSDIKKKGYLRKLKTMKKKYFVLRGTSSSGPARLEYYDSEKKFNMNQPPKRAIDLHTCFNINKKVDFKYKYAIALFTKDDCFTVLADNIVEQEEWVNVLLEFQEEYVYQDMAREHYEHVWQVNVKAKGLALKTDHRHIRGNHRLCLSSQNISLVKLNTDKPIYVFQLATVRSLAINDCQFRLEVGGLASTGEGELWMQVDDANTAQVMHDSIFQCMKAADYDVKMKERQRSGTLNSTVSPRSNYPIETPRSRTNTFSATQSPSRVRSKISEKRPVSCSPNVSLAFQQSYNSLPSTSPHFSSDYPGGHRLRSDSSESHASRRSKHEDEFDYFCSGVGDIVQPISEEESYITSLDLSSLPSSPSELQEHLKMSPEDVGGSPYMVMQSGTTTPPSNISNLSHINNINGYMEMSSKSQRTSGDSSPVSGGSDGYLNMSLSRPPASSPIPIRGLPEMSYKDLSCHTSHLPTVTEGGSNEGYLPMSPTSTGQSSYSSEHLKPEPAICMISDDTVEFPKRTYSLGSKPPVNQSGKCSGYLDMTIVKGVNDKGRSCSAPHLIPNRKIHLDSPTPSASPLSSSMRSDDSESFMEFDFYRPRTASDSYSYRPRASSFGNKSLQAHRPRSSSHGQQARAYKTKPFDSARTTSEELRQSLIASRGSSDSLRMSSSESLRKLSREVRAKTSLLSTDYLDMSIDKRKTPSPQPAFYQTPQPNGYVDMTLGKRNTSPGRGGRTPQERSGSFSGSFHKTRDQVIQERSGSFSSGTSHRILPVSEIPTKKSHSSDIVHRVSTSSLTDSKPGDVYINMNISSSSQTSETSKKSVKDNSRSSSSENLELYVMYEPSTTSSIKKTSRVQQSESFKHTGADSATRELRRKSGSKSKSGLLFSSSELNSLSDLNDEYIEFSPMASKSSSGKMNPVQQDRSQLSVKQANITSGKRDSKIASKENVDSSEYIGYQPGSMTTKSADKEDNSEYMGYQPGVINSPLSTSNQTEDTSVYMGYEPRRDVSKNQPIAGQMVVQKSYFGPQTKESRKSPTIANQKDVKKTKSKSKIADESEYLDFLPANIPDLNHSTPKLIAKNPSQQLGTDQPTNQKASADQPNSNPKVVFSNDDYLLTEKLESKADNTNKILPSLINPPAILSPDDKSSIKKSPVRLKNNNNSSSSISTATVQDSVKIDTGQSRHSTSDLSGYEQMSFPNTNMAKKTKQGSTSSVSSTGKNANEGGQSLNSIGPASNVVSSMCNLTVGGPTLNTANSQPQLLGGDEERLNYADLDLGSSENIGEDGLRSPRIKSRHASAIDDKGEPPLSYAEIDFEKCESMKALTQNNNKTHN